MPSVDAISKATAEKVIALLLRQSAELNELVAELQGETVGEEYRQARLVIGMIVGEICLQGLHPLFVSHPELTPPELPK
jgi:hypothetical protein